MRSAFVHRGGDGLFAEDAFYPARRDDGGNGGVIVAPGGGDAHDVEVFLFQHLLVVGVERLDAPLLAELLQALRVEVGAGD